MLIAEAVLLLALDDDKGALDSGVWMQIDSTLGGALLLDLALRGKIDITGEAEPGLATNGDPVKAGRVVIRDAVPTGDPDLDAALDRLAKVDGKKPDAAVPVAAKGARAALTQRLVTAGVLSERRTKVLGLFPRTRWPAAQEAPEKDLRARILQVLDERAELDPRAEPDRFVGYVIALLQSAQILAAVFPTKDKELRKAREASAKKLAAAQGDADWAVGATGAAVQATMAATAATAAITASMAATTVIITS
jgi:hypothetical protein